MYFVRVVFSSKKGETLPHNTPYKNLFNPVIKSCGQFVVFLYKGNVYLVKIINFKVEHIYISVMVESLKSWKWPKKPHILQCERSDVLGGINPPKLVSERGFDSIPELSTFFAFGLSVSWL
jgi:hypothetical protein